jgi:DNA-binding transcriptional ArsR family regulator
MAQFQRKPHLIIDNLEALQVLSHPLRSQLLDQFDAEPQTVKQVAAKLGMTANKLYYHVKMLQEHGLLAVVETRTVGNMIERLYQTAAERFEVDANLLSFSAHGGPERAEQFVVTSLDATRQDLLRSMEARRTRRERGEELRPSTAMVTRCTSRLTEGRAKEFRRRLTALLQEFGDADLGADGTPPEGAADAPETDVETYSLAVAFYASFGFPKQDGASQKEAGE